MSDSIGKNRLTKRQFISMSGMLGVSSVGIAMSNFNLTGTPPQAEGPFFPVKDQIDKDADMTQVIGRTEIADGEIVIINGTVVDKDQNPVANVVIDAWQACATGKYNHPADPNTAELDPNFQYWAKMITNEQGVFKLKTIIPGAYPATSTWTRPPHIHFRFDAWGTRLTTQMYFGGNSLNRSDRLLIETKRDYGQEAHDSLIVNFKENPETQALTGDFNVVFDETPSLL